MRNRFVWYIIILLSFLSCKKGIDITFVEGTDVTVWNGANHNAFTDLIKYNGVYYCVFREGINHDSDDGKLRVLESLNGKNWNSFALLYIEGEDLRDPHFFIDNHNVLSIGSNARNNQVRKNVIFKLKNGNLIESNAVNTDNDYWLWSFSKSSNKLYSIGYNLKQKCFSIASSQKLKIALFQNIDTACANFLTNTANDWISNDFKCPSEASLIFMPDSTLVTIVRDGASGGDSHIGISKYPYNNWHWQQFPYFIRGPKLALLPDGKIFLAAGSMVNYTNTYYAILNENTFAVEKLKVFPSGGDNGYPGVIIEGNTALISYYSSHEGNSRVYIERINY